MLKVTRVMYSYLLLNFTQMQTRISPCDLACPFTCLVAVHAHHTCDAILLQFSSLIPKLLMLFTSLVTHHRDFPHQHRDTSPVAHTQMLM